LGTELIRKLTWLFCPFRKAYDAAEALGVLALVVGRLKAAASWAL